MYIHLNVLLFFIGWTLKLRVYIKRENKQKQKYVWAKYFTLSNSVDQCNGCVMTQETVGRWGAWPAAWLSQPIGEALLANRAAHRESGPSRRSAAVRGSLLGCFLPDRRKSQQAVSSVSLLLLQLLSSFK